MGVRIQLGLLMWKNFTYRRRLPIQLIFEILWPLLLFFILVTVREGTMLGKVHEECHFLNKALPSAGTISWIQSLFCTDPNPCQASVTDGEFPGVVENFNDSLFSHVLANTRNIIRLMNDTKVQDSLTGVAANLRHLKSRSAPKTALKVKSYLKKNETFSQFIRANASLPPELVDQLMESRLKLLMFLRPSLPLKQIVCSPSILSEYLKARDAGLAGRLQKALCSLTEPTLHALQSTFVSEVDWAQLSMERPASRSGQVTNAVESLWSLLQRIESLAKFQVSPVASFVEFLESLRVSSGRAPHSSRQGSNFSLERIFCGSSLKTAFKAFPSGTHEQTSGEDVTPYRRPDFFCKILYKVFYQRPFYHFLFTGKIFYTPPTPVTHRIMAEVNRTFENLAKIHEVKEAWDKLKPQLEAFMEKSPEMRAIKDLLSTPGMARVLERRFRGFSWNTSALRQFLSAEPEEGTEAYTWRKAYAQLGGVLTTMSDLVKCIPLDRMEAVPTEEELVRRSMTLLKTLPGSFWAGIVFLLPDGQERAVTELPSHVQFKIRMDIKATRSTNSIKDWSWIPGAHSGHAFMKYARYGFVYVQDLVEQAVARLRWGPSSQPHRTGIYVQQMPYPCYVDDIGLRIVNSLLPLFLTLAWVYSVAMIVKAVVHEKETRLKETMKIMGLSTSTLWLGWLLSCLIPFLISASLILVILKTGAIFYHSDPGVLFSFFATFSLATVAQCFLISTFFSRANVASGCSGVAYFSCYLAYSLCSKWRDVIPFPVHVLVNLLSPAAFCFGCEYITNYEEQGVGIHWRNMFSSPMELDCYSMGAAGAWLLFDTFLYGLLTLYIEAVFPGQYGIPKPWYFPFQRSFWFGDSSGDDFLSLVPVDSLPSPEALVEEPPTHLNVGVSIRNLVKVYHGNKIAIKGLNLDFYEDQITSFLGHNGAGKTSTISVLTGLLPPSSGTAYILGKDICSEMDAIRKTLGICPQHNVLFDILTVEEHVWFYGHLKGLSGKLVREEMEQIIKDVGLSNKRWAQTKKLSGGMQRKLSVAIAFVGGSKVVFLDEPTAGIDPYSRRDIWELLLKYKPGRTIILSTHYMDEADLLGDRVAIISQGRLCCCGSSLFLKTKLGTGYYLTLVKKDAGAGHNAANLKVGNISEVTMKVRLSLKDRSKDQGKAASKDTSPLTVLIQKFVPNARLVEDIGQEVIYNLPYGGEKDGSFGKLLQELDKRLNELGVSGYGISDTSLEEIFLKVADDPSTESPGSREATHPEGTAGEPSGIPALPPVEESLGLLGGQAVELLRVTLQQLRGLLTKRYLHASRSRRAFVVQILLPAIFILIAMSAANISLFFGNYPPLRLDPWMYGPQHTFISDESLPGDLSSSQLLKALLEDPGFGTKCMKEKLRDPCASSHNTGFTVPDVTHSLMDIIASSNWTPANPSPECVCDFEGNWKMFPDCPEGAGGLPPPRMKTKTGDTLYNLTGRSVSDYLMKTYPKFTSGRYGGFSLGARMPEAFPTLEEAEAMVQGVRGRIAVTEGSSLDKLLANLPSFVDGLDTPRYMKVWFNNRGWHAMVSFVNVANNGILRANLPPGADPSRHGISVINHPLDAAKEQQSESAVMKTAVNLLVSICVMFGMSFIPASFVLFLIEERVSKAKHLQIVGGMSPVLYWLSNFLWDLCKYLVVAVFVLIIFLCFQEKSYVSPSNLPALIFLLLLYGWAVIPMMYPASFFFNIPSTAYITLTCLNIFIAINTSVTTFILDIAIDEKMNKTNILLKQYFLLFPQYCLGRGLMDMVTNQGFNDTWYDQHTYEPPLNWKIVGRNLFAMFFDGIIFFVFTLLMQYHFFIRLPVCTTVPDPSGEEDEDVANERKRIHSRLFMEDILVLQDLTKVYFLSRKPAVNHLCLGIPEGECFGLLGVNGAGKTTTFQMLTGGSQVTSGNAFLRGYSIATNPRGVHRYMGYCPQFDAIFNLLTAREHLVLYCRMHGVPEKDIPGVVNAGLSTMGLTHYADRLAGQYSGGNKRKLSTAIALVGAPPVIFLDEPTTGMDPCAKRFLWNCILGMIRDGRSVVLTSHSMEECEALCTRMAIMVNGRFQCLGTVQHLKNKFGEGYTIILRIAGTDPDMGPVETFMQDTFPGIVLKEKHHSTLQFQLPTHCCSLAKVFDVLSANWSKYNIRDYSISQTTLDQVFVHFAKEQSEGAQVEEGPKGPRKWIIEILG